MAYCRSCGIELEVGAQFCPSCGTPVATNLGAAPQQNTAFAQQAIPIEMNLVNAFKRVVLENYANFNGRASKAEYWWYYLAAMLLSMGTAVIDVILGTSFVNPMLSLALMLPGLAVNTRRLHDTNRSGWWILISLTIIGIIPLIIWLVQVSDSSENRFGPVPTV
jgi:uncharacterized membrane protein YhaH (DUF805 family)